MRSGWRPSGERRLFFTYIMSNPSMTLYVGMTNNLRDRVWQHKNGVGSKFVHRYRVFSLVYFEYSTDTVAAIAREKQLKGWTRDRKIALVKTMNPGWRDLSAEWF